MEFPGRPVPGRGRPFLHMGMPVQRSMGRLPAALEHKCHRPLVRALLFFMNWHTQLEARIKVIRIKAPWPVY